MENLIKAAKELNELLDLTPAIEVNPNKTNEKTLLKKLGEASELIEEADEISKDTIITLRKSGVWLCQDKKVNAKFAEVEEEEEIEEEGEVEESLSLLEQIQQAETKAELKEISKVNDEFKGFRGILTRYKTKIDLQKAMIAWVDDEKGGTAPEPIAKVDVKKVAPVKEEEDGKEEILQKEAEKKPVEKKKISILDIIKPTLLPLLKEGTHNKKEIIKEITSKYPEIKEITLNTMLTDSKNPKYNKLDLLVVENTKGHLSFSK
jgi:hypothetical protein